MSVKMLRESTEKQRSLLESIFWVEKLSCRQLNGWLLKLKTIWCIARKSGFWILDEISFSLVKFKRGCTLNPKFFHRICLIRWGCHFWVNLKVSIESDEKMTSIFVLHRFLWILWKHWLSDKLVVFDYLCTLVIQYFKTFLSVVLKVTDLWDSR